MICLAVDLLGADRPEAELCRGAAAALRRREDLFLYLFGHSETINGILGEISACAGRYEAVDAPDAITNLDDPMQSYLRRDASLVKAFRLCRERPEIAGIVTCGATGAILVCAIMLLDKIRGMRPVLLSQLKTAHGEPLCLLDCGAYTECRPEHFVSFARVGSAYMQALGCEAPRTALLSNGIEETKGSETVRAATALLRQTKLNFIGSVEANRALSGDTDVIVCDGFQGNILLKAIEGTAKAVLDELTQRLPQKNGETECLLTEIRKKYDYNTQGGALLLGVKPLVMKGHGAATGETIENLILRACELGENRLTERFEACFRQEKR